MQLVALGDGTPAVLSIGPQAVGVFAVGQEASGIIAIGQIATGVIAVGHFARGVVAVGQLAIGAVAVGQGAFGLFAVGMGAIGVVFQAGFGIGGTSAISSKLALWGKLHVDRVFDPHARGPILENGGLPGWRIALALVGTLLLAGAWWKITGEPLRAAIREM